MARAAACPVSPQSPELAGVSRHVGLIDTARPLRHAVSNAFGVLVQLSKALERSSLLLLDWSAFPRAIPTAWLDNNIGAHQASSSPPSAAPARRNSRKRSRVFSGTGALDSEFHSQITEKWPVPGYRNAAPFPLCAFSNFP
jgi:hypothetical protein